MSNQNQCSYEKEYIDIDRRRPHRYCCRRTALPDEEYCELHSSELWKSDSGKVLAAFKEELKGFANDEGHKCLIGFHLPDIDLSNRFFEKQIYFQHTVFHGRAVFENSTFAEGSFRECRFEKHASFEWVKFNQNADFLSMRARDLSFVHAEFAALTQLSDCVIRKGDFRYAKFSKVQIRGSKFERAYFNDVRFDGYCDMNGSYFENASFDNAQFTAALISGVTFHEKADFLRVTFKRPEEVRFNSNLTQVSFLETDLSKIRLGVDTEWSRESDFRPYDLRKFKADSGRKRFYDVLSVLRELRDNYEYRLEYEGAGKLFVQEMEMKRQYKDSNGIVEIRPLCWRLLSLTAWYKHLCTYGESFRRPALWALAVFGGWVLFFCLDGAYVDAGTCPLTGSDRLQYALTRTLAGLFHWGCQALPDYALRGLSIPVLGTIFVVLRRRFERRFRH